MKKIIEIVESEKTIKKYITLTLLKEVKRKESIQKLFLLLQKRLQSTDKIVLFDLLFDMFIFIHFTLFGFLRWGMISKIM